MVNGFIPSPSPSKFKGEGDNRGEVDKQPWWCYDGACWGGGIVKDAGEWVRESNLRSHESRVYYYAFEPSKANLYKNERPRIQGDKPTQ